MANYIFYKTSDGTITMQKTFRTQAGADKIVVIK